MRCIGTDLGYGRTKMYSGDSCKANFPSLVSTQLPAQTFALNGQEYHTVTVNGIKHLVGREAELHGLTCLETRRDNFVCDDGWFALLGTALHMASFDPGQDVLTIGLPPGLLGFEKREEVLRKIAETPMHYDHTGMTYALDGTKVLVVPQGLGIYFSHCMAVGSVLDLNVAVVDLGHHTLDLIYINHNQYINKSRLTKPNGVGKQLDEIINNEQSRKGGRKLRYADLVAGMDKNAGLINPNSPYFVPVACGLLKSYTSTVLSVIQSYIDSTEGVDLCLIGGGGARFLLPDREYEKFLVVRNPEMANAIGYWGYGSAQSPN